MNKGNGVLMHARSLRNPLSLKQISFFVRKRSLDDDQPF